MAYIRERITKFGKVYKAEVKIKGHPPVSQTFPKKWEAEQWAEQTENALRSGGYIGNTPPNDLLFSDAANRYEDTVLIKKRPTTVARERSILKNLARFFGGRLLSKITTGMVAEYRQRRERDGVIGSTILREFNVLSDLFEAARLDWSCRTANPVKDARKPKRSAGRIRFLDEIEARIFLDCCCESDNEKLYPYVLTMMHTGMRPSEAAGMRWRQVDLAARTIMLEETKTDRPRTVPVTETVIKALRKLKPKAADQDDYVFLPGKVTNYIGIRPNRYFRRSFTTAQKHTGLPAFTMHDLRHTAASHLLMAGVDIRTIAEILGHTTLEMLMRYTHLKTEHTLQAVDKINWLGRR